MAAPVPDYDSAVATVFRQQGPVQRAAILKGAKANPTSKAGAAVLRAAGGRVAPLRGVPAAPATQQPAAVPKLLSRPGYILSPRNGPLPTKGPDVLGKIEALVGSALHGATHQGDITQYAHQPGVKPSSVLPIAAANANAGAMFGGAKGAAQILKNTGSDAWNFPGGTVEGLATLGKDVVTGHEGDAFKMLIDPYVQFLKNPGQTFYQHPLNTALMLSGPKAVAGHVAGSLARSGVLGDAAAEAASTVREPLALGTVGGKPSTITEARSFSRDPFNKALQVAHDRVVKSKGLNPNVSHSAPAALPRMLQQAFNIGTGAKLNRIADEMTGVRQMAGRVERARVTGDLHAAAKGASKESLPIVSHVLQGVIRTPETADADMAREINRLKAAQTGKRTVQQAWNKAQVRDLSKAAATPGAIKDAFGVADKVRETLHTQDAKLVAKGLLDPEQAQRARVFPYAMAHMGAKYDRATGNLVKANGSPLSTDEILTHIKNAGMDDPAFVGHFPGKVAAYRFYKAYKLARGSLGTAKRTGEAFRTGAYDHSFEGVVGQAAQRAEALTNASLHDKIISRLGIRKPEENIRQDVQQVLDRVKAKKLSPADAKAQIKSLRTGLFTPDEAARYAYSLTHDDNDEPIPQSLELTPITAAPRAQIGRILDLQKPADAQNLDGAELEHVSAAIKDAASRHDSTRNVALIPTVAAERFGKQFERTSGILRSMGRVTQQFRRTVLPYSTHWMLQIGTEAHLRALVAGALDPRYYMDGRRLMKRLTTTEDGRAALSEMTGATMYSKRDLMAVHNPNMGKVVAAAHAFPPTRGLIAAHNLYANFIGQAMHGLEHQYRLMGLGKLSHQEVSEFSQSWQNAVRLQGQSLDHLATKLESSPALVAKLGRQIDDMFGKYSKFSPSVRAAVQSYAPFLPWYLNAARFVLWQLPAKSPVASSLMASLRQTVNQDIKDGKQLPLNGWAMQELSRLTPFNILAPATDEPSVTGALQAQGATGAILPQVMGSLYNLAGVNVYGSGPLKGPSGDIGALTGGTLPAAGENLLESFMPLARYVREAEAGGRTTYGTSTLFSPQPEPGQKKGSVSAVVDRIFNPLYAVQKDQATKSAPPYAPPKVPKGRGALSLPSVNMPAVSLPSINLPSVP